MLLFETTALEEHQLPIEAFQAHLRLGTGYAEETLQTPVLVGFLRAAIASIEGRVHRILISREFSADIQEHNGFSEIPLPVGPVHPLVSVDEIDAASGVTPVSQDRYSLTRRLGRDHLVGRLPILVNGAKLRVKFKAGLASDWSTLPADLQQAVLLLAAHYYEYRTETKLDTGCAPFGVICLIERFRLQRVGGGV